MNKLAILLFGLTIGLISPPASTHVPVEKIAYDICWYYPSSGYYACNIQVANVDGTGSIWAPMEATEPAWSPDGTRIALTDFWGSGIYVWNPEDGSVTALDPNYSYAGSPTWAPDGQRIAFWSFISGPMELYAWHANGSLTQLTNRAGVLGSPAWSPDGTRIAFDCEAVPGNRDICALELANGAVTRLTTYVGPDSGAAWSPDGTRIAFSTEQFAGQSEIAVMNSDGSQVSRLGQGVLGYQPSWSPSGSRLAYQTSGGPCDEYGFCTDVIYLVNLDGTGQTFFGYGFDPAWGATSEFGRPLASFYYSCTDLACSFNGTGSWDNGGQITGYSWDFGDGGSGSGGMINHTFPAPGTYLVTLTVVDNDGFEGTTTHSVTIVILPQAVVAVSCSGLTCTFDGSGSSDADGTIVEYMWAFGDDTWASGPGPSATHTYQYGGNYNGWLRVTDNGGAAGFTFFTVTVTSVPSHVGDLDGSSTSLRDKWTPNVTISVHDANHQAIANVTVSGSWSTGAPGTCITNGVGQCTIFSAPLKNSVAQATFTVGSVSAQYGTYDPAANHDPDGDSNGSSITVQKR